LPWDEVLAKFDRGFSDSVEVCASDGSTADDVVFGSPGCLVAWRSSSLFHGLLRRGVCSATTSEGGAEGTTRTDGGWYEETENL